MPGRYRNLAAFILCCGIVLTAELSGHFYRIDVLLTQFNNSNSIIYNGKYCDVFTDCDPLLHAYIDVQMPFAPFPGSARSLSDFTNLFYKRDINIVNMDNLITRTICGSSHGILPQNVTVRVDARDYDYFTKNDLIDEFDCTFRFHPSANRNDTRWSEERTCNSRHQPQKIKLFYRWRILAINPDECSSKRIRISKP